MINKIEYCKYKELIQVSIKYEVESMISKENIGRFKLVYSLSLLERDLYEILGISGEGKLLEDIPQDHAMLEEYPEIKEIM